MHLRSNDTKAPVMAKRLFNGVENVGSVKSASLNTLAPSEYAAAATPLLHVKRNANALLSAHVEIIFTCPPEGRRPNSITKLTDAVIGG